MNNTYELVLIHHGTKGQKWGVRRYQNPDGTLTDAGRKRYLKKASRYEKKASKSTDSTKAEKYKTKAAAAKKKVRTSDLAKARIAKAAKKAEEAKLEEEKQRILKSGSAEDVMRIKDRLNNKELNDAYNRLNNERLISSLITKKENKTGVDKFEEVMNKIDKVRVGIDKGVSAYNTTAKIFNSVSASKIPVLDGGTSKAEAVKKATEAADAAKKKAREEHLRTVKKSDVVKNMKDYSTSELKELTARWGYEDAVAKKLKEELKKRNNK